MLKLLKNLKPYKWSIAAIMALMFISSLADLYLPTFMSDMVDIGIVQDNFGFIIRTGGWMLLVTLLGASCTIISGYLAARASVGLGMILRNKVFTKVESFSLHEFDEFGTASLITRTTNDITQVQQVSNMMLTLMVRAPLTCIGGIVMALSKDATLSWTLVVVMPLLLSIIFLIGRRATPLFQAMQKKIDKLNLVVREGLTGMRVIRAFNRVDYEAERFKQTNRDLTNTAIKVNVTLSTMMPIMMLFMNVTTLAIIWFGSWRINNGAMQVGDLMAFIQYVMQIMFSLLMLSMLFVMVPRAAASAVRINEVLDTAPSIKDSDEATEAPRGDGRIEFRNVTFSYSGAETPALSDITFTAYPGQTTAIVGGTGAGKTTLLNLICRFYDVSAGQILVDGTDIRQMTLASLRAKIGFVPQKTMLFSGTVADNIKFGKEDAGTAEVAAAAATAQAAEFITEMSAGFQTAIVQGGTNLSGGQKQRLAIARALVGKPEINLFDDSFSALDYTTDAKLRAELQKTTAATTVIIVAQRVSTVLGADRIIVLDEGRIVGNGSHKELYHTCEAYREIISSQLSEEELA